MRLQTHPVKQPRLDIQARRERCHAHTKLPRGRGAGALRFGVWVGAGCGRRSGPHQGIGMDMAQWDGDIVIQHCLPRLCGTYVVQSSVGYCGRTLGHHAAERGQGCEVSTPDVGALGGNSRQLLATLVQDLPVPMLHLQFHFHRR